MKHRSPAERDLLRHKIFRIVITLIEIALITVAVIVGISIYRDAGFAEEWDEHEEEFEIAYVICSKGDRVNIRRFPNTKGEPDGYLEPGDMVYLDGRKKNGFRHCVGLNTEMGEGWVHSGYLVEDRPEPVNRTGIIASRNKVKARKNVNGKRTRWLKPGGTVKVYYWSDNWCVTDCGYVMSKYIELDGE